MFQSCLIAVKGCLLSGVLQQAHNQGDAGKRLSASSSFSPPFYL